MQVLYNACLGTSLDPSFLHITNLWILSDPCNIQRHTFVTLNFHLDNFLSTPPIIILFCWSSWNTFWHGFQPCKQHMNLCRSRVHHLTTSRVENHDQPIALGWKLHLGLHSSSKCQNMWDFNPLFIWIHPLRIKWVFQLSFAFHWPYFRLVCFK